MRVGAHRAQAAHADRARGGAVGVVIADDDDPLAAGDRVREALRGGADVREAREIGERAERVVELRRVDDAARRVDAREHRRDARGGERRRGFRDGAANDHAGAGAIM